VLLDIVLGSEDAATSCENFDSSATCQCLSHGRGLESERIAGLKLGADDYIVKPFSLGEVSQDRVGASSFGANLAQLHIDAPTMHFGDLLINENTHEVHCAAVCSS